MIAAYAADEFRREVNRRSADLLGCRYVYASEYPGSTPEEKIRALVLSESPDLIVTFHPVTGFRRSEAHAAVGRIVTELVEDGAVRAILFYAINRDPALEEFLGGADEDEPTHALDLTIDVGGKTLYEVKLADICLYSSLVRSADAICRDVGDLQERMLKVEFYEQYVPRTDS